MDNLVVGIITHDLLRISKLLNDFHDLHCMLIEEEPWKVHILVVLNNPKNSLQDEALQDELQRKNPDLNLMFIDKSRQYQDAVQGVFGETFVFNECKGPIVEMRTILQRYLFEYMSHVSDSIGLVLDDDFRLIESKKQTISNVLIEQILSLKQAKNFGIDVVLGSIIGSAPNPPLHGLQGVLFDIKENIRWMKYLSPHVVLPNRSNENRMHRELFSEYYYDLTRVHTGHLETPFWVEPISSKETVEEAYRRLIHSISSAVSGYGLTRMIHRVTTRNKWYPSVNRGGITFILEPTILKNTPNMGPMYKGVSARRSDMIWAILNRDYFNVTIVQSDIQLYHQGEVVNKEPKTIQISVEKIQAELLGSSLYKAMKESMKREDILSLTVKYLEERQQQLSSSLKRIVVLAYDIKELVADLSVKESMNHILSIVNRIPEEWDYTSVEETIKEFLDGIGTKIQEYQYAVEHKPSSMYMENRYPFQKGATLKSEMLTSLAHCGLPSIYGDIDHYRLKNQNWSMIIKGKLENIQENPMVRLHSSCMFSEIFKARDCDCGEQLDAAMKEMGKSSPGRVIVFYLEQEGRGHGLYHKTKILHTMHAYHVNTYQACDDLGLEHDVRDFTGSVQMLKELGVQKIQLISNNPYKIASFKDTGIEVQVIKTIPTVHSDNEDYLRSKKEYGHHLEISDTHPIQFYRSQDAYGWLSNLSDHSLKTDNQIYATVEHYYQSAKFTDPDIQSFIQKAKTPIQAKKIADSYQGEIIVDWDEKKENVMYKALNLKFSQHQNLKKQLLETQQRWIIENSPKDLYWGSGPNNEGKNRLGHLLMKLRQTLLEES